ncbi:MAG: hypothetical protein RLZZ609_431 [Cyanobacteriota bacterium]|jgi:hypothetical protein
MANPTTFTIMRDDGIDDGIAGRSFTSFDEAYIVLESYYADTCCSDEQETYRIVEVAGLP